MTTKKQNKLLEKLKTVSKKKLVAIVSALLLLCVAGGFIIINKNTSAPVETADSNPVVEAETLPEDYFEPSVELYNGYNEVLPYVAGEKFVITDYVNVKAYNNEFNIYFETINDGGVSKAYQDEGLHKIKIHVIDKFKHEAILETHLLTEKKEVIEKLCAEDYKPTVSDYENLQKKMAEEQEAKKKAEEAKAKQTIEEVPYGAGYDPNSRAVQVAQDIINTCSGGNCEQVADEFMFRYFNYGSISDTGFYEVSEADAIPGDRIIYQTGKAHTAIYLGGGMALHGGLNGSIKILGVRALTNVQDPKFYRYDPDNPNGYTNPYNDGVPTAKTADGAKEAEPSSNMSYDEWVDTLPEDVTALRDACIANYETMDREAAKASPECTAYRDAAHPF